MTHTSNEVIATSQNDDSIVNIRTVFWKKITDGITLGSCTELETGMPFQTKQKKRVRETGTRKPMQ